MSTVIEPTDPTVSPDPIPSPDGKTYCAVHPTIETALRCNKCGRYMCVKCAVRTPVGYRCKQCVHVLQDAYFTATQIDYVIAGIVALVVSVPMGFVIPRLPLIFALLLALPAGGFLAQIVHRALRKRRGRYIWVVVAAAIVIGAIIPQFQLLQIMFRTGEMELATRLLPTVIYVVLVAAGATAMLRYGK